MLMQCAASGCADDPVDIAAGAYRESIEILRGYYPGDRVYANFELSFAG